LTLRHLNTFAYCLASQCEAVARASGATPLTAPPMTAAAFPRRLLEGRDLLYIALHGMPGEPYLYGDGYETALMLEVLEGLDLSHTTVLITACHFTETPGLQAFLDCRPRLVIAGDGPNYARNITPVGAHLLGHSLRRGLQLGLAPAAAFRLAQFRLQRAVIAPTRHTIRNVEDRAANRDALQFRTYTQGDHPHAT
jgi:hypothetical protein